VDGETFVGGQGVDNAVHEDFRRLGVFSRMNRLMNEHRLKRGEALGYGVSNNPIVTKTWKKLDMSLHVLPVIFFLWINDFERFAEAHPMRYTQLKKIGYKILRTYNRMQKSFERSVEGGGFSINKITHFDDNVDELWLEASKGFDYIIERRSDYLNWRYCDPRGGSYEVLAATESGGMIGYAALRVDRYREDYPIGHVADVLALPERIGVVDSLLEESFRIFNEAGVNEAYCWMSLGHPYKRALERRGFLDLGKRVNYAISPNLIDETILKNTLDKGKKIHVMIGDSDWI
jgi:hypothetical protein